MKKIAVGAFAMALLFLLGVFLFYKSKTKAGVVFDLRDMWSGERELRLRWVSRVGYPALAVWAFIPPEGEASLIFYTTEIPSLGLKSSPIFLPARLKNGTALAIILVKKEWFPTILKRLPAGSRFQVRVRMVIKKNEKYLTLWRTAPVLYSGRVMGGEK